MVGNSKEEYDDNEEQSLSLHAENDFCTFFSCAHDINTPLKKAIKPFTRVFLLGLPVPPNKCL
jgi:hypothetical protein